jgi:hypothetical protein
MTTKRLPRLDLNPSSADRWTTCTASPRFILENWDKLPSTTDTVYNVEGTRAHEVASSLLQGTTLKEDSAYTPEMHRHGWDYMEYVESLRKPEGRIIVEQKLPLWYMKERNAIVDAAVVNSDSLHVVDYKYGEGVVVSPVENLQAAIYAVSVGTMGAPLPTAHPVFLHIFQPRGRAAEEVPQVWETTWYELNQFVQRIDEAALVIQANDPAQKFVPSEKGCQWCPAKGFCKARQNSLAEGLEVIDEVSASFPPANMITETQMVAILKHKAAIESWMDDVEEFATERLKAGVPVPGFKLVLSRGGNRYWTDPKKAAELLLKDTVLKRDEVIDEKVISPGGAEKLLGKRKFTGELMELIAKTPGVPVLAPVEDKREAVGNVLEDFEVLPEQNNENTKQKP